jgi:hypothetical protein
VPHPCRFLLIAMKVIFNVSDCRSESHPMQQPQRFHLEWGSLANTYDILGLVNIGRQDACRVNVKCPELPHIVKEIQRLTADKKWTPCTGGRDYFDRSELKKTIFNNERLIAGAGEGGARVSVELSWKDITLKNTTTQYWELTYNYETQTVDINPKS